MKQDEIISMALEAGLIEVAQVYIERLEHFAAIVASRERSIISETFWAAVNDCITTDELGVEFMSKFYQVHEFGHWLDGENK